MPTVCNCITNACQVVENENENESKYSCRKMPSRSAAFWSLQEKLAPSRHAEDLKLVADLEKTVTELQRNMKDTKLRLKEARKRCLVRSRLHEIDLESMRALKPRLCFWEPRGRLPEDLSIKIFREAGVEARSRAAQVCNDFNNVIRSGRVRGAFDVNSGSIAAGGDHGCDLYFRRTSTDLWKWEIRSTRPRWYGY